jgi:hypothetical protein
MLNFLQKIIGNDTERSLKEIQLLVSGIIPRFYAQPEVFTAERSTTELLPNIKLPT